MKQLIASLIIFLGFAAMAAGQAVSQQELNEITAHYENEQFDEVIRLLKPLIQQYDLNEDAYQLLISSYLQIGQRESAREWIDQAIYRFPSSLDLRVLEIEAETTDPGKALQLLRMTISDSKTGLLESERLKLDHLYDFKARLHMIIGRQNLDQMEYESAIEHFEAATELAPEHIDTYRGLLFAYLNAEDYNKILQAYQLIPENLQSDHQLTTLRSHALVELGKMDEVLDLYRELYEENSEDISTALIYGQLLIETGQLTDAGELYQNLLEKYPQERKIYDFLIDLNQRSGNYEAVVNVIKRQMEQFPEEEDLPLQLARAHQLNGNIDQAIAVYDSLQTERGNIYEVVHPKAVLLFRQEKKKDAYKELKLIEDRNAHHNIEKQLGKIALQKGKPGAAVEHFSEYLATSPADSITLILKARSLSETGNESETKTTYQKAIKSGANWPEAYLHIFQNNQHKAEYIDEWLKAFSNSIRNIEARKQVLMFEAQLAIQDMDIFQDQSFYPKDKQLRDLQESLWDLYEYGKQTLPQDSFEKLLWDLKDRHPDYPAIYEMTGNFYKEFDETRALSVYKNGLEINSNNRYVLQTIAEIKQNQGEIDEAILWYERANSVEPTPEVYRELIRLNRVQGTLDQLINRWLIRFHARTATDPILQEYLIDALHRAGRSEEAREIAEQS
jgi:tetratricopeptide (TPR) repeat protein